ncbi:MAG: hypothetical protein ACNA71_07010 [Kiritimatiellia bacterium]
MSRPVALILNTANLLGPALLFLALILLGVTAWGDWSSEEKGYLVTRAGILIASALLIRLIWGISVAIIRRKQTADHRPQTTDPNPASGVRCPASSENENEYENR